MFLIAITLAVNPHPDLWLDDTAFAARHCPAELDHLTDCIRVLTETATAPPKGRPNARRARRALENLVWRQELTTDAARDLEAAIGRTRDQIRANPAHYWVPRLTTPAISGDG